MRASHAVAERLRHPPRRRRRPKHWIAVVLDSRVLPRHRISAAVVLGAVPFVIGVVLAAAGGFVGLYLESYPVYFSAVLTGWVFAFGDYSDSALWRLPRRIRPAFRTDPQAYRARTRRFHRRLYSHWNSLVPAVPLSVAFVVVIVRWPEFWGGWFPPEFSAGPSFPLKVTILCVNGCILVFLGVAMVWGYVNYVAYAYRVSTYRTIDSINAARVHLRPVTSFGITTGLGWSVAVTLFVSSLARDLDLTAVVFLAIFGTMGFVLLILPQLLVHCCLQREQDRHLLVAARRLRRHLPQSTVRYVRVMAARNPAAHDLFRLESFLERASATSTWVYSPRDALVLSGEILLPVLALAVTIWTQG